MRDKTGADAGLAANTPDDLVGPAPFGLVGPVGIGDHLTADGHEVGFSLRDDGVHVSWVVQTADHGHERFLYRRFYLAALSALQPRG